jgi:hypothetical protein
MKYQTLIITTALGVMFLFTGVLYAANGDLIVNGNLGVGTSAPGAKADINGNLKVNGTVTNNGETINGNAVITSATITSVTMGTATVTGNATVNGNLGVGVTTPAYKLDVAGKIHASQGQAVYLMNNPSPCNGGPDYYSDASCTIAAPAVGSFTTISKIYKQVIMAPWCTACTSGNPTFIGRLLAP